MEKRLTINNIQKIQGQTLYTDSVWRALEDINNLVGVVAVITAVTETPDKYELRISCPAIETITNIDDCVLYIERVSNSEQWRLSLYEIGGYTRWIGMRSEAGLQMYRLLDTLKDILIQHPVTNTIRAGQA